MNKVLFVATVVKKHINVFHLPFLKMFKENGWETSVCARNDFESDKEPVIPNCDNYYDMPFERFPIKLNNIKVYKKMKKLISEEGYNIVHCHTPTGGLVARLASLKFRKKGVKVIYTAHGFHFYKGAPIINWLLYFPVEWICSFFTDTLITINKEDYIFAQKHMHSKEVKYVPGVGLDLKKIKNVLIDCEKKRQELGIGKEQIAVLSVGELNENKNHETVIRAISKIDNKNIVHVVCGEGPKKDYLKKLATELGVNLLLLGFRTDIVEIYKSCDIYAFPSKREGLSVALMEAMASGLPAVCSCVRGNTDLVDDGQNGFLCKATDVDSFAEKIQMLIENGRLCLEMSENSKKNIQKFSLEKISESLSDIYFK